MLRSIPELISEVKAFALFNEVEGLLLDSGSSVKSKIWTLEIFTQYMNQLISLFLHSRHERIDAFFAGFLADKYAEDRAKKQKFCFTFLLSLKSFREKHSYVRLYEQLFAEEKDYAVFHFFWEMRSVALELRGVADHQFLNLDRVFLGQKHWQLVLSFCFDYKLEEILSFEADLQARISQVKHEARGEKVISYTRNGEYCLTFLIREALARFSQLHFLTKHGQGGSAEVDAQYQSLRHKVSQARVSRLAGFASFENNEEALRAKLLEKERLISEIKNEARATNRYKESTVKLISHLEEIDPFTAEIRDRLQSLREVFLRTRRERLKGDEAENFATQSTAAMTNFLDRGSSLFASNGPVIKRKLLNLNEAVYNKVVERTLDYRPKIKALIAGLRKIIFEEEFRVANDQEARDLGLVRAELEKLFAKFGKLENSQRLILETFFQNLEKGEPGDNKVQVNNLLERVSQKIASIISQGLGEGSPLEIEDQAAFEKDLRTAFNDELGKFETLTGEHSRRGVPAPAEFQKNRYSSKPLPFKRGSVFDRGGPAPPGAPEDPAGKPLFLNFNKSKVLQDSPSGVDGGHHRQTQDVYDDDINRECDDESEHGYQEEELPEGARDPGAEPRSEHLNHEISQVSSEHLIQTQLENSISRNFAPYDLEENPRTNPIMELRDLNRGKSPSQAPHFGPGALAESQPNGHRLNRQPGDSQKKLASMSGRNPAEAKDMPAFNTFNTAKKDSQVAEMRGSNLISNINKQLTQSANVSVSKRAKEDLRDSVTGARNHSQVSGLDNDGRGSFNSLSVRRDRVTVGEHAEIPAGSRITNISAIPEELQEHLDNEVRRTGPMDGSLDDIPPQGQREYSVKAHDPYTEAGVKEHEIISDDEE